jgi:hypothetical protein
MAVVSSHTAAWAQTPAAASSPSSLPIGTPLTIVADETVDPRVRPGSEFRAHLRDPLTLGDQLVATAGTPARLIVTGKEIAKDGTPTYRIAIVGLNLGLAGTLPVRPDTAAVGRIAAGMDIPATTLAIVGIDEGKVRVVVPLPFKLSNEPPAAGYTPAPLRTAGPILNNRRRPSRSRSPAPSPTPSASPAASASPPAAPSAPPAASSSAAPTPTPTPAPQPAST